MKIIFADTFYWIALLNPRDNWHHTALNYARKYESDRLITTDGIIDETLNYFATRGIVMRKKALALCLKISQEPTIQVIPYTTQLRQAGFYLFNPRPDKCYSLTDCISMIVMKQMKITEVLTHDRHFTQEGFKILFQDSLIKDSFL
jgi:predicted nucleic acid-binding protein